MNQQQFLLECGRSYPDAMAALAYFRQLVQQRCKPVVEQRLQELGEILGVPRQDLKLLEHANPDKPAAAVPDQVELGWKAKRAENLYLYFYIYWLREPEEDSAPLGVAITIWIKDGNKRDTLAAKLEQLSDDSAFDGEPWTYSAYSDIIEFWMDLKEDELPQVDDKLDELSGYTVRFLKSLKGITNYFRV